MIKWKTQDDLYLLGMLNPGVADNQIDLTVLSDQKKDDTQEEVFLRGITGKVLKYRYNNNLPFWYMDTGYWGNYKDVNNFKGFKILLIVYLSL